MIYFIHDHSLMCQAYILCTGRGGLSSLKLGLISALGLMYGGILVAGVSGGVGLPGMGLCW